MAEPSDLNAEKFVATCTCKTKNNVWMKPDFNGTKGRYEGGYANAV